MFRLLGFEIKLQVDETDLRFLVQVWEELPNSLGHAGELERLRHSERSTITTKFGADETAAFGLQMIETQFSPTVELTAVHHTRQHFGCFGKPQTELLEYQRWFH